MRVRPHTLQRGSCGNRSPRMRGQEAARATDVRRRCQVISCWNVRRRARIRKRENRERIRIVTMSALKMSTVAALIYGCSAVGVNRSTPEFRVIAFFTAKQDQAHISFVHEAERWFPAM